MKMIMSLWILVVSGIITLGGVLFDYCLYSFTKVDIGFGVDILCGIVTSSIIVPVTIVTAILRAAGIEVPFIDGRVK